MYQLSVPIMASTVHPHNREIYAMQCKNANVSRIFLCVPSPKEGVPPTLSDTVAYFKSQGFTVGLWTDTIGHGVVLKHVETDNNDAEYTEMVDITGKTLPFTNCPLDPAFRSHIARHIAALAKTGADIVMLDDDFRMSQHGEELCCACPAHLKRIGELLEERVTLDAIRPYVLSGKENKYRSAWLEAQNEGLVALAKAIRAEVDKESPDVTVCFCTAYSPWNVDKTDVEGIARILAGKNPPLLRLTGAPYWAVKKRNYPLISVFEIARMLASFAEPWDIELMSEGDVYPRPRYTCPASYLELYDAVTRADGGYDGILKYMFDYVAGPELETGYLKFHEENTPYLETIEQLFKNGANVGVRVYAYPHTMETADLDLSRVTLHTPRPTDGAMLGACGIPTVYRGEGFCNSVFGENARRFPLDALKNGTVLDAVSAVILTQRGIDVGLGTIGELQKKEIAFLCTEDVEYKSFISDGKVRLLDAMLNASAKVLLYSSEPRGRTPVAYSYENADGQRFLVFLFEGDSMYSLSRVCDSGLMKNYATQRVLVEMLPWVARAPLPAYIKGNPNCYLMCKEDESTLSVALFNCFADALTEPVIVLSEPYARIECFGCDAVLEGNRIVLREKLHGFTSAAFRVYKS